MQRVSSGYRRDFGLLGMSRVTAAFSAEMIKMAFEIKVPPISLAGAGTKSRSGVGINAAIPRISGTRTGGGAPLSVKAPKPPKFSFPSTKSTGVRAGVPKGAKPAQVTPRIDKQTELRSDR